MRKLRRSGRVLRAMANVITVEAVQSGTLLAYGRALNPRRWFYLALAVIFIIACAAFIGFWLTLRQPIIIPERAAIIIKLAPARARELLPKNLNTNLPVSWQSAINQNTSWPVIFGAFRDATGWKTFAILPRWLSVNESLIQSHSGIMTIIADSVFPLEKRVINFLDFGNNQLAFYPANILTPGPEMQGLLPDNTVIRADIRGNFLQTDLTFKTSESLLALHEADISINLNQDPALFDLTQAFFVQAPPLLSLFRDGVLDPAQISFNLNDEGKPEQILINFHFQLSDLQKRHALASFGLTNERALRLNDGTLATELILPALISSTSTTFATKFGHLELREMEIMLHDPLTDNQLQVTKDICPVSEHWMRLSRPTISALLKSVGVLTSFNEFPAVILGTSNGKLILCFVE